MLMFNVLVPQLFWFKKIRQNMMIVLIISILVNIGMWFERFVIVVGSLYQRFPAVELGLLQADAGWTFCTYVGTFGLFFTLFLLFMRFLPMIAIAEVKGRHAAGRSRITRWAAARKEGMPLMADCSPTPYGIIAEFETAAADLHAAEKVRDAGFRRWDVYTPFPVHGMDRAMGMRNSKVGWFSFLGGVTGYTCGMLMIWYMNALRLPDHRGRQADVQPVLGLSAVV